MTDINQVCQVFEDCLTVFACSFHIPWHPHPPQVRLLRMKCNYDWLKVEEEHNKCVSHLSHKWTQRRVTVGTVLDHSGKKRGLYWTTDPTAYWLWANLLVHGGFIENSRSEGSPPLWYLSLNWTVPHTGLGSAAEVNKGGLKEKKKKTHTWKQTVHFFFFFLNVAAQTGICKYYVCRFVWVTGWIFSLWQQVQVKMTCVILTLMLDVSIIHYFLNLKANWRDLQTQKWVLTAQLILWSHSSRKKVAAGSVCLNAVWG